MALTNAQKQLIFQAYLESRPEEEPVEKSFQLFHDFIASATKAEQKAQAVLQITTMRDDRQAIHDAVDAAAAAQKAALTALISDLNDVITELGGIP